MAAARFSTSHAGFVPPPPRRPPSPRRAPRTSAPATSARATGYVRTPDEQASIYFREHSSAVYRYVAGVYGREEDAEEVTQEAFLRLHQALVANVVIDSPRAWALTVARRLMLDRLRHEHSAATRTVAVGAEVIEAVRDSAPSPEDSLVKRRRLAALHERSATCPTSSASACTRAPRASP